MRSKAMFAAGFATGYVLGSRAGRQRYEQIRQAARSFASSPVVHNAATQVQHQAGDVLSTAKDKAAGKISDRLHDRRPAWLSPHSGTDTPTRAAGSNGHVGT